jgi:hypothetical protein
MAMGASSAAMDAGERGSAAAVGRRMDPYPRNDLPLGLLHPAPSPRRGARLTSARCRPLRRAKNFRRFSAQTASPDTRSLTSSRPRCGLTTGSGLLFVPLPPRPEEPPSSHSVSKLQQTQPAAHELRYATEIDAISRDPPPECLSIRRPDRRRTRTRETVENLPTLVGISRLLRNLSPPTGKCSDDKRWGDGTRLGSRACARVRREDSAPRSA